jgi:hypothetical protein
MESQKTQVGTNIQEQGRTPAESPKTLKEEVADRFDPVELVALTGIESLVGDSAADAKNTLVPKQAYPFEFKVAMSGSLSVGLAGTQKIRLDLGALAIALGVELVKAGHDKALDRALETAIAVSKKIVGAKESDRKKILGTKIETDLKVKPVQFDQVWGAIDRAKGSMPDISGTPRKQVNIEVFEKVGVAVPVSHVESAAV